MSLAGDNEPMLHTILAREATRLSMGRQLPLDLTLLLGELQIELLSEPAQGAGQGYLRRSDRRWQIVVRANSSPRRARFTIAHELGHYLLEARVGPDARPCSTREYWALERICSTFAARLLAPTKMVESALTTPIEMTQLTGAVEAISIAADLALEGAARRVLECVDRPLALGAIDLAINGRSARSTKRSLLWLHANQPWINCGRGKLLRRYHVLRVAAAEAFELRPLDQTLIALPGASYVMLDRREQGLVLLSAAIEH